MENDVLLSSLATYGVWLHGRLKIPLCIFSVASTDNIVNPFCWSTDTYLPPTLTRFSLKYRTKISIIRYVTKQL